MAERKASKSTAAQINRLKTKPAAAEPREDSGSKDKAGKNDFPIIGIGASAGGLEALEQFFTHMPSDSGASFIVVSHLDPTHPSMMADLLKRFTKMDVLEAKDGMHVKPDHVYMIPPNNDMTIFHGSLHLSAPAERHGMRMPVDFFFRSLADDQGEKAICIVLSGTGTDGTLGLRDIHGAGGLCLVQDPARARYDGMPKSAINTGMADYVLPAEKIPEQLINYLKLGYPTQAKKHLRGAERPPGSFQKIFMLLRARTGHDFSLYKKNTTYRRIDRRMSLHAIQDVSTYLRYLQERPDEVQLLLKDLLISVTSFFRDKEAFEALKKVLPKLLQDKPEDYSLRVWVPGCASGEEVYSIAIMLREYAKEIGRDFRFQIFATDIDEDAINTARAGLYPGNIVSDVTPERLKAFFVKEGNGYRIKKELRETVVFALQNIIKDTPFTKLDLVSCRNLLIYLDTELQEKLLPLFHYSLKPDGILFLGSSESIGRFADLFSVVDKKWRLYRRKGSISTHQALQFTGFTAAHEHPLVEAKFKKPQAFSVEDIIPKLLIESFVPPCAIINQKGEILYLQGRTGKYLEPAPGKAAMNIQDMAKEGLNFELRAAIRRAISEKKDVIMKDVQVKTNGKVQPINMTVKPIKEPEPAQGLLMVVFEDIPVKKGEPRKKKGKTAKGHDNRLEDLERELKYTKENLQATIEELQASNEELKSTNEELQSTNEELQSTNEELETSREEMQSVNEELVTVNSELQAKVEQLMHTEGDLKNLLDSTKMGTIFLDKRLYIKRFTPEAVKMINLIASDAGRPIGHIVSNLGYDNLVSDAQKVLDTLTAVETEVQAKDNNWYLMRILPYRTIDDVIDGVVLTFSDITHLKKTTEELRKSSASLEASKKYAESIVDTVREALLVLDANLRVISANRSFYSLFQVTKKETEGRLIYDLGTGQWDNPELKKLLEEVMPHDTHFDNFTLDFEFPNIGRGKMLLNARGIDLDERDKGKILLAIEDITQAAGKE